MTKTERIIFVLIMLALVALVIMEVRKHTMPPAAADVTNAPSDASNNFVSAGAGGPSYLTYNTPGQYSVGPPLQNYSAAQISPNMMAGNGCSVCAPFQSSGGH